MSTLLELECKERAPELAIGAASAPLAESQTRCVLPLVAVLATFLAASAVTWRQQVTSIEMNRNDAAFYLVLGRNIVEQGVYSHQQETPFRPHTEWPPGVPLLYSLPMSLVSETGSLGGRLLIHGFTLLVSSLALAAVYAFVRQRESVAIAVAVTAATMASHAFLDSAQAATADTIAVAATFFGLWMLERSSLSSPQPACRGGLLDSALLDRRATQSSAKAREPLGQSQWGLWVMLACVPLVKPYLGMLFPAYLAKLIQQSDTGRQRFHAVASLALCCLPFAGFIGYSVIAAQQSGTISALTWFTTDNPLEIREVTNVADTKTASDWLRQSADAVRFHLIYHTVAAPLPWLSWCELPDWSWPARLLMFVAVGGLMLLGAWQSWRQRDVVSLSYTAAMFAFFVLFACDSARYFTVLTPMCALLFCRGIRFVTERHGEPEGVSPRTHRARRPGANALRLASVSLLVSALLATGFWVRYRAGHAHDPHPFYDDLYAALQVVRDDSAIAELHVPYQLREIARLETGKRIRVTQGETDRDEIGTGVSRLTFRPREEALQKRYAKFLTSEAAEASHDAAFHRIWSSSTQQVHVELADVQEQP